MSWNELLPTIMVADSDEDERCLMKSILELKGFQVLEALDGQEAIEIAVRKRPDLLLIQLKLPVVSGFTAIRRIKKHDELRDVPIIAISFNNPTSNHNLALAAGCNAHVENPIEFDLLDALIDRLLPGDRLPLASALIQ
ncbi:MAG: response regulator [Pyrinomonadaceae bacterium]|nr:response regulator [Pyrinomonadaceae bacterium]